MVVRTLSKQKATKFDVSYCFLERIIQHFSLYPLFGCTTNLVTASYLFVCFIIFINYIFLCIDFILFF